MQLLTCGSASAMAHCAEASMGDSEKTISVHAKRFSVYKNELCQKCLVAVQPKMEVF
jgi:hypothetical protein